uniref:Uncharacterized protein n=1 Tax=Tetraselmis sp. GSL018 TaxID=582737 RepID=A0A061S5Q5_9CHLO|mmetsp:Transcript_36825/g.87497  ORF Transcript_36825/g.87497 Transcript_36825/m.87497 type:complete len:95 (-) Transcript_36825:48-332(-)
MRRHRPIILTERTSSCPLHDPPLEQFIANAALPGFPRMGIAPRHAAAPSPPPDGALGAGGDSPGELFLSRTPEHHFRRAAGTHSRPTASGRLPS